MTNSRSKASTSKLLAVLVVLCAGLGIGGTAHADRKRVVVLDFEGPKSEKFHDDLVKLIKKTHTVISTDKWNGTAEELGAAQVSEKSLKKVAKRLKIDAIVEGRIEKRRDDFIIHLKLREGRSGELIGSSIDTKAQGPRIDGKAQRDLKDELVEAIDNVASNRGGAAGAADDEDDARPAKKAARKAEDADDEDRPAKKPAKKTDDADDEDRPVRKGFSRHSDDERGNDKVEKKSAKKPEDDEDKLPAKKSAKKPEDDEDKLPAKKSAKKPEDDEDKLPAKRSAKKPEDDEDKLPARKLAAKSDDDDDGDRPKPKKKVAASDEDASAEVDAEAGPPVDAAAALSPGERALDAVVGVSLTARRLAFTSRAGFMAKPASYKGNPVGGAMIDATLYPLALGHKRSDVLKNIGLNVNYDRVIGIKSKDPVSNQLLATTESRYGFGGVFRYPLSRSPSALVVGGTLAYSSQTFSIAQPTGGANFLPSVKYTIIEPGALLSYPVTPKIGVGLDAKVMVITNTGQIQQPTQYGTATVLGFEGALHADYLITRNIFARAAFRYETIGFKFKGNGAQANARDNDPMTIDVTAARDSYIGGFVTAGYLY